MSSELGVDNQVNGKETAILESIGTSVAELSSAVTNNSKVGEGVQGVFALAKELFKVEGMSALVMNVAAAAGLTGSNAGSNELDIVLKEQLEVVLLEKRELRVS
jgi:hypothetical protein